ncbi:SDR family NAD(P)-dependent oxidoreductase [Candidatus Saccharibacteria bacterium]|nr:SDR family NAD(P)-dependent oxidoreductase [Candidatus Saccharibacteria bacterium]
MSKTIIITGASDGIGAAAARQLVSDGHRVVMIGHDQTKTKKIAKELGADYFTVDYTRLSDVNQLADKLLTKYPKIDVLINNAGGLFNRRRTETSDGHETTFQVNFLASYLLTRRLLDRLVESHATVIFTSSIGHKLFGNLDLDDLELQRNYKSLRAYGNSKIMLILFARELNRRYGKEGLATATFHPGMIATNIAHEPTDALHSVYHTPLKYLWTRPASVGARTMIWLAERKPGTDWPSGEYFVRKKVAKTSQQANDEKLAGEVWQKAEDTLAQYLRNGEK